MNRPGLQSSLLIGPVLFFFFFLPHWPFHAHHLLRVGVQAEGDGAGAYSVRGLTLSGKKQVLGIYTAESESASFWLTVA